MNAAVLLAISMAAQILGNVAKKYYSDRFQSAKMRHINNAAVSLFVAIVLIFWGGIGNISLFTLLLGVAFGVVTALQQIFNMKAMEIGPLSYTSVIVSLSTLISALSGAIFWNEVIGISQIVGIALMVVCFFLSVNTGKDEKKSSFKWLIFCLIAFFCSGAIGILQKVHQNSSFGSELNGFLFVAFISSFLYSFVCIFLQKPKSNDNVGKEKQEQPNIKVLTTLLLLSGICAVVANKLNLYLVGVMDSAVFFPINNGGVLVISIVASVLFFKEKLSVRQWLGIAAGIISVVLLCNPF